MTAECGADVRPADLPIPRKRRHRRYKPAVRSIADMDRRTAAARNAAELVKRLEADLGGDPTTAQQELATRAALLSVLCGDAEVAIVRGQPIDTAAYCGLVACQRRVLSALGLTRDPKLINGHANGQQALANEFPNVWPEFRAQERERSVRDLGRLSEWLAETERDDEPKSDEPKSDTPTQEDDPQ
jgi:hypothetical protein